MNDYYFVVLEEQEGSYLARVPDVPGCVTGGTDINEAIYMVRDALAGCLCVYEDESIKLPLRKTIAELKEEYSDKLLFMIDVDTLEYRKRTETKAVRRTVSLPKWLDQLAIKSNVSLSNILQEALMLKLL